MLVLEVLKPDIRKLVLFVGFAFLCVAGATQSYAFIDDVPGLERPPLYDVLRPFSFWFPWVLFSAPLHVSAALVCSVVDVCGSMFSVFPSMGAVKFPVTGVIYSFIAASWLVYSWDRWLSGSSRRTRLLVLVTPLVITTALFGPQLLMVAEPGLASFMISGFFLTCAVLEFYFAAVYGIGKAIIGSVIPWTSARFRLIKS